MLASARPYSTVLASLFLTWALAAQGWASSGDPLAVRLWPDGVVTIETHWNVTLCFETRGSPGPAARPSADIAFALQGAQVGTQRQEQRVEWMELSELDHYLDRLENESELRWTKALQASFVGPNAIHVAGLAGGCVLVSVDGLRVAILCQPSSLAQRVEQRPSRLENIDVVVLNAERERTGSESAIAEALNPRVILSLSANSAAGNTCAISSRSAATQHLTAEDQVAAQPREVSVGHAPWEIPEELQTLFERKEHACRESQAVFSKLSTKQMSFAPANGSHTPRWNAEHMMGRELLFFSQIYANVDPAIPVMNLNPQQMPPDYKAAHPEWSGAEEARQMERVLAFTRRFAYLLDGLELDKKPQGSSWTPRGLLRQMERHYSEHTANVIKKFELEDWPKE